MGFSILRRDSVPCSVNDYTHKTLAEYVPRCEKTCAVCAVKDWIENRAEVYLFAEATSKTTLAKYFYGGGRQTIGASSDGDVEDIAEDHCIDGEHFDAGLLLMRDEHFCFGPKAQINDLLHVDIYAQRWPLIPIEDGICIFAKCFL